MDYGQQQSYSQQPPGGYGSQQYQQAPLNQSAPSETSDTGSFQGISYTIKHRNTNSTLEVQIPAGDMIKSKPGAMIHMSPSVVLQGQIKMSFKKMFTGTQMVTSSYTGPGMVALAPTMIGDIVALQVGQSARVWKVNRHAFLASTGGVGMEAKSQGMGKAFLSGNNLFVYHMEGNGLVWLSAYGAVEPIRVSARADLIIIRLRYIH